MHRHMPDSYSNGIAFAISIAYANSIMHTDGYYTDNGNPIADTYSNTISNTYSYPHSPLEHDE